MARLCHLNRPHPLSSSFRIFILLISTLFFSNVNGGSDRSKPQPARTSINHDLYHSSDALMEEIGALVNRHPDRLSMETFKTKNKGYEAELNVVTFCRNRKETDDRSKYRILLMIACIPEFWAACPGAHYN